MRHPMPLLLLPMLLATLAATAATPASRDAHATSAHRDTMHSRTDAGELQLHGTPGGVVVDIASPASANTLHAGDTIVAVGKRRVTDLGSLQDALRALDGREATLVLQSGTTSRTVVVAGDAYETWIPPDAPPPPYPNATPPSPPPPPQSSAGDPTSAKRLSATIVALDTQAFEAFNHCEDPAQLHRHAGFFADDIEFYHDTGGVTWTRKAMLANTKKYVCGHYRRERIDGSVQVYPVKDFGAIEQGVHRFCQIDTGSCDGMADFVIVWRLENGEWRITRVLSYGHRANTPTAAAHDAATGT